MTGNRQYSDPSAQLVSGEYAHSGAPGSEPSRTRPADDTAPPDVFSGLPGIGVQAPLSDQMGAGENLSVNQPGQVDGSAISPGDAGQYADTGAGRGRAVIDSSGRRSWQQKAQDW